MTHQFFLPDPTDRQIVGMRQVQSYAFYLNCHRLFYSPARPHGGYALDYCIVTSLGTIAYALQNQAVSHVLLKYRQKKKESLRASQE
jgi:hypothetical protein